MPDDEDGVADGRPRRLKVRASQNKCIPEARVASKSTLFHRKTQSVCARRLEFCA